MTDPLRTLLMAAACALLAMLSGMARAADDSLPPTPMLRIETGMHTAMINRMALVEGNRVVTVSDDKTARLWSAADGRPLSVLRGPVGPDDEGALYAVAASGVKVAVAGRTGPSWDNGAHFIYLYDVSRDGERMTGRLGRLDSPVIALAFSRDGRWLAAGLQGSGGVVLYDLTAKKLYADKDYRDTVQWLDFAADGSLAAASSDGAVKLYAAGSQLQTPRLGGVRGVTPWSIAFSPDGQTLALGSHGGDAVTLLAAKDLAPLRTLKGDGRKGGGFPVTAWAPDGSAVYGAGTYADQAGRWYARKWTPDGRSAEDLALGTRTVTDLVPVAGGLYYATTEPSWGLAGRNAFVRGPAFLDLRGTQLRTATDGGTVEFTTVKGKYAFSLKGAGFAAVSAKAPVAARLEAAAAPPPGLKVEGWQNGGAVTVNGRKLALDAAEHGQAAAFSAGGRWALGTEFYLRLYQGESQLWRAVAPAAVRGVILTPDGRWVIGAFADGTIRWYRSRDGVEDLAFFPHADGTRWIVWTPEGYFDHSRPTDTVGGGEDLVGYHVNRGKKLEAEFVAIGQIYSTYYRRDLVMNAFRGRPPAAPAALAEAAPARLPATEAPVQAMVAKGMPPRVKLVELCSLDPARNAESCQAAATVSTRGLSAGAPAVAVPSREITLRVVTEDRGAGIEDTVVRRNGAVVPTARSLSPMQTLARSSGTSAGSPEPAGVHMEEHKMILDRGANLIDISAFAKGGRMEAKEEDRVGLKVVFSPGNADEKDKDVVLHIISVGVNKYPNLPPSMQLDNSDHDARGIVKMMKASEGRVYAKVDAKVIVDDQATTENILKAIDDVVARTAPRPQDMVLIFFAGHGFAVDQEYYFVPTTINPKGEKLRSQADVDRIIKAGGMNQRVLMQHISKLQTAKALLLLDTCHSGALINSGFGNPTEQSEKSQNMSQTMGSAIGRAVIAAADQDEEALDGGEVGGGQTLAVVGRTRFDPSDEASPDSPHGLFTKFILQGLAGAADFSKDGVVTMSELATYVQEIVPGQALALGKQQRPSVSYKSRGPFSLRYVNVN